MTLSQQTQSKTVMVVKVLCWLVNSLCSEPFVVTAVPRLPQPRPRSHPSIQDQQLKGYTRLAWPGTLEPCCCNLAATFPIGYLSVFLSFFLSFFLMWTIFKKSLLNLSQFCFCFMCWFLARRHVGSQFPDQGLNPQPLPWKAKS